MERMQQRVNILQEKNTMMQVAVERAREEKRETEEQVRSLKKQIESLESEKQEKDMNLQTMKEQVETCSTYFVSEAKVQALEESLRESTSKNHSLQTKISYLE